MEIRLVNDLDSSGLPEEVRSQYGNGSGNTLDAGQHVDVENLVRKYWLLLVVLLVAGAAGGFVTVVLSLPMYKARVVLKVPSENETFLKNFGGMNFEANEVNIQTQISILRGETFLQRGAERLQADVVPLAPMGRDLFSRLRKRIRPASLDPIESSKQGLSVAMATFDARPINRTTLIELTCESTSPDIAAQFLNAMAAEFVEDNSQSRMQSSQKTNEWLSAQIEDTKSKLQEDEQRLQTFVQSSGNLFVGQEAATLADTELSKAKANLADMQAQRIAAQIRYELSLKASSPETLAEVQNDLPLRSYRQEIESLKQQRAALTITLTPRHEKVQKVDAQIAQLENSVQQRQNAIVRKIHDDYEALLKSEKHQADYYRQKSQLVSAEAGKAAQYNALRREVETLRQNYSSLLGQANQAGLSNSVPIDPIRVVEPSSPPAAPYKPRPALNILFGTILGLAGTAGFVYLRERMDRSVRAPGSMRGLLNAPELGVIPHLSLPANSEAKLLSGPPHSWENGSTISIEGSTEDKKDAALALWESAPSFMAESFRETLASILRTHGHAKTQRTILITSPGPGEGKTTVVHNLGIALAETGRKILLVDADFRRPHLHKAFHLPNDRSLIDLIYEEKPLTEYPADHWGVSTGVAGLSVLPNRSTDSNVARALYSPRLRAIFQRLREMYDMVLVDAPPVLHLADARIIAPLTDAAILVLRSGVTPRKSALEAYRRMHEDGLFLLGTVLTGWEVSNSYLKRHYYYDYVDGDKK